MQTMEKNPTIPHLLKKFCSLGPMIITAYSQCACQSHCIALRAFIRKKYSSNKTYFTC